MIKKQGSTLVKRNEIYVVNFDQTVGSEIKKMRPALILQNDISNQYSPITIVAAITSKPERTLYPTEVSISYLQKQSGLKNDSVILLNQIRTIDKNRLIKKLGKLNQETMLQTDIALKISLGLVDI
jgi:mRNA interferase MazF